MRQMQDGSFLEQAPHAMTFADINSNLRHSQILFQNDPPNTCREIVDMTELRAGYNIHLSHH